MNHTPYLTTRPNPARSLTKDDRSRGGKTSASIQARDSKGKFAGRKHGPTLCSECGKYPADHNGICAGCDAYKEHTSI